MDQNKNSILASAAHFALFLGLYWVFRYLFVIGSDYSELFRYIVSVIGIGTPLVIYVILCRYRDTVFDGKISYGDCIKFTVPLCFFASLIESVIIAIHVIILNPSTLIRLQEEVIKAYEKFNFSPEIIDFAKNNMTIGPLYYIASTIFSNIFIGLFLSLILGYFVSRFPKTASK